MITKLEINLSWCCLSQNSKDPMEAHLALSLAALESATKPATLLAAARRIVEIIIAAPGSRNRLVREGPRI
jgi:hypothetical protein